MTESPVETPCLTPADIEAANAAAQQLAYRLKAVIRELTGGWGAWCSSTGVLYATRDRTLSNAEMEAGLAMTLHADSPNGLVEKIHEQLRIETTRNARKSKPIGL